jgi:hypothetical protein
MTFGRCSNFDYCVSADAGEKIPIPPGVTTIACPTCGKPAISGASPNLAVSPPGSREGIARRGLSGNPVTWPFEQRDWFASLWMPLIWWFLPPFGGFISLGWSTDAVRRRGRRSAQPLPQPSELSRVLKDGLIVFVMAFIYFAIPLFVISQAVQLHWLGQLVDIGLWIRDAAFNNPHEDARLFLARQAGKLLTNAETPGLYIAVAAPLFLTARIRYALTGRILSFFDLVANVTLCVRHIEGVLLYLFLSLITQVALGFVGLLFAATGIGLLISLFLGGAAVWILAYLAGNLAAEIHEVEKLGSPL